MSHPVFAACPWFDRPAPVPGTVAGMLGRHETSLFYHLAKDFFTGRGTIVDAGSFLGKSAFAFAQGLRANLAFDATRHRVHCFDDFVCHDDNTIEIVRNAIGPHLTIGQSTVELFEAQVAPVRDVLEVHAGDFHEIVWPHQPIEILMVDIAKTKSLGSRVLEVFFPDLLPGHSLVVHQDYHHPWLPHIHVVMEYLAEYFELVAPAVDDSAAFALNQPIPPPMLARAIAHEFTAKEQLELMDRAIARLPEESRGQVELARLILMSLLSQRVSLSAELESFERRYPALAAGDQHAYFSRVRNYLDVLEADELCRRGDFKRALAVADGLIARHGRVLQALEARATALVGLGRNDEAVQTLEQARGQPIVQGAGRVSLARIYASIGRNDDAERLLIDDLLDPRVAIGHRASLFDEVCSLWERHHRPEHEDGILDQMRQDLPGESEVDLLAARSSFLRGDRTTAQQHMHAALLRGANRDRCAKLLEPLGLTPDDVMRGV